MAFRCTDSRRSILGINCDSLNKPNYVQGVNVFELVDKFV